MKESLLVIDKIPGPTSFDVVRSVKRLFPGAKVGHTGSLDPFASGVLILLLGRATKLSNTLLNADKTYHATIKLGESTDTMDRTGKSDQSREVPTLTQETVEKVLQDFQGTWLQTPPMFSAKKIQGVRLYELARKNISVRREPVAVQLYKLQLIRLESPIIEVEVHCSKGTYIRSFADELGRRLGTVAHLHELRRLSCGPFYLKDSVTLDQLEQDASGWHSRGYQHYLKLLKTEGVFPSPSRNPSSSRGGSSFANATQQ
jgi:tRNA pseudouridine55 synthase